LSQTEQFQAFSDLWVDTVDTSDTDNNSELWHSWDVEVLASAGHTAKTNSILLLLLVLSNVRFGTLEDIGLVSLLFLFVLDLINSSLSS